MHPIISRAKRILSLDEFENNSSPLKIKPIELVCPFGNQNILRMPISNNGRDFYLPNKLEWLAPLVEMAFNFQKDFIKVRHTFCYVTVRHGEVISKTDDEWHVDGFSTRITHIPEQNYIWTNTNPTEYSNISVKFPDNFDPLKHNINWYLQKFVKNIEQCEEKVLYCMDPYILHRRPINTAGTKRTFVRISFVPIEIADTANTPNPILPLTTARNGVEYRNRLTDYESTEIKSNKSYK